MVLDYNFHIWERKVEHLLAFHVLDDHIFDAQSPSGLNELKECEKSDARAKEDILAFP